MKSLGGNTFLMDDLQNDWVDLTVHIASDGAPAEPRGLPTRELLGVTLRFPEDCTNLLPVGVGRGVSVKFNAAGAAQLVGGVSYPQLLTRIAPRFAEFDSDGVDRERYGPRSVDQVTGAVRMLLNDQHSREAIVTLQPPMKDEKGGGRVFPCTTSIQFFVRGFSLHMSVHMRSNDVWSGLSGDAWTFSQLQRTLAWVLGLDVGQYVHHAASLHVYESDLDKLDGLHPADRPGVEAPGFTMPGWQVGPLDRLRSAREWGREALGIKTGNPLWEKALPANAEWYAERIRPYWSERGAYVHRWGERAGDVVEYQAP